jgi:hypothetical protein
MPLSAGRALAAAVRRLPTANRIDDLLHAAGYAACSAPGPQTHGASGSVVADLPRTSASALTT